MTGTTLDGMDPVFAGRLQRLAQARGWEAIDATMAPFGGRFVLHGDGNRRVLEGSFSGDIIMLSFPNRRAAEAWYESPAYQAILPLRTRNSDGDVLLHAITDALGHENLTMPATPQKVWAAIRH